MALTPQFVNPFAQGTVPNWPQPMDAAAAQVGTGAGGAAEAIAVTGQTGRKIVVTQVAWSYSAAPTGGGISISDGTTTIALDITAAGIGSLAFYPPLAFAVSTDVTVTLAAPGGAVVGKLFVNANVQK